MSSPERRRNPRIDVLGQVHVRIVTAPTPATLRDISLGGFSIETTTAFPPGLWHDFHLSLDDGSELRARAKSVHCALVRMAAGLPMHITGFEFLQREARVRDEVDEFVGRITAMIAVA
jgi:c-di-GMP-binding flagellar brake protein YcgR